MRYRITNKFTNEFIEWDSLDKGVRSVNQSNGTPTKLPLLPTARDEFAYMLDNGISHMLGISCIFTIIKEKGQ